MKRKALVKIAFTNLNGDYIDDINEGSEFTIEKVNSDTEKCMCYNNRLYFQLSVNVIQLFTKEVIEDEQRT